MTWCHIHTYLIICILLHWFDIAMYCNIFTWHISDYQKKECVDIIHFTTVHIHNIWSLQTSLTLLHTNPDINIASETKIQIFWFNITLFHWLLLQYVFSTQKSMMNVYNEYSKLLLLRNMIDQSDCVKN